MERKSDRIKQAVEKLTVILPSWPTVEIRNRDRKMTSQTQLTIPLLRFCWRWKFMKYFSKLDKYFLLIVQPNWHDNQFTGPWGWRSCTKTTRTRSPTSTTGYKTNIFLNIKNIFLIFLSNDGMNIISSSADDQIIIYDCEKGTQKFSLNSKKYGVDLIHFTQNKNHAVHASTKENDIIRSV